jgi:hypothetical protein
MSVKKAQVFMSEDNENLSSEPETSSLHLGKIISSRSGGGAGGGAGDEGATIMIKKAAAEVAGESAKPVVVPKGAGTAVPPAELLGAVTYAYAKGVFSSEDIEEKMMEDPEVRNALAGEVPDARAIRRFRYLNREAILATLEKFYFWRRKQGPGQTGQGRPVAVSGSTQADGSSTVLVRQQAARKLDEAASVDNMLKDQA